MHKILLVIVLYNRDLVTCQTYISLLERALLEERVGVFVYDNTPPQFTVAQEPVLTNVPFATEVCRWKYISDPTNRGISFAYNRAGEFAQAYGYDWITLLDQDTLFSPTYLNTLLETIDAHPDINLIAPKVITSKGLVMSPTKLRLQMNWEAHLAAGINSLKHITLINSGISIRISEFLKVGGYNEKIFLDFSDVEFIERFKKSNSIFYLLKETAIQDFSNDDTNTDNLLKRFRIFCICAYYYKRTAPSESLGLYLVVAKACLSRCVRTRKIDFIKIVYNIFLVSPPL